MMTGMGRLQQENGRAWWPLPARCLLGRSRACPIRLTEPEVSGEHALLRWISGVWELQDLHSRNGTFLDGRLLSSGQRATLLRGSVLGFGRPDGYVLIDAEPPQPFAVHVRTTDVIEAEGNFLTLPHRQRPEQMIYRDRHGWSLEQAGDVVTVEDGEVVQTSAGAWRLHLPEQLVQTCEGGPPGLTVASLSLRFCVSRDEEYVELTAFNGPRTFDLKARAHHYPLLQLARIRLADPNQSPEQQGWVHQADLLRQLGSDANRLHLDFYRLRRQLVEIGVEDAAQIVERRSGTRQLRIGVARLEITQLTQGAPSDGGPL